MKITLDSPSEEVRIEIIPLIDVIFCILTFFILGAVGISRQQAITLDVPAANTSSGVSPNKEMAIVRLDPIGQIFFEQELVTRDQLYERVRDYRKLYPNKQIGLFASELVAYDEVISLLDLLRAVGGARVALVTRPATPAQPAGTTPTATPIPGQPGTAPFPPGNPNNPFNSGNTLNNPFNPDGSFSDPFNPLATPGAEIPANPGQLPPPSTPRAVPPISPGLPAVPNNSPPSARQ